MAQFNQSGKNFAERLKGSVERLYKPEFVKVASNPSVGYFVSIEVTNEVRLDLTHENTRGWNLDFFRLNKDGTRSKRFINKSVSLLPPPATFVSHRDVADRFMQEFSNLLDNEPSLGNLYNETARNNFQRSIAQYWEKRVPEIEQEKDRRVEGERKGEKRNNFDQLFFGSMIGFLVLGLLLVVVGA